MTVEYKQLYSVFYDCFYQWTVSSAIPAREARLAEDWTTAGTSATPLGARSPMTASASGLIYFT